VSDPITKITWRNSPWTAVIGLPLLVVLFAVLVIHWTIRRPHLHAIRAACQQNLRALADAKAAWAKDGHRNESELPADNDLFGTEKYLREKPACPMNGSYTFGNVGEKPRCSILGHTI
jgi:hypothetical protein